MTEKLDKRILTLFAHLVCLLFVALAVIYYKEFTLKLDGPMMVLELLDRKSFFFFFGRWGTFSVQILPLAGIHLKLSLQAILILMSIAHPILFYGIYLLVRYYSRRPYMALLPVALVFVGSGEVFLHRQWTLLLGIVYFGLFAAWVFQPLKGKSKRYRFIFYLIAIWEMIVISMTHTAFVLCIIFILAYLFLQKEELGQVKKKVLLFAFTTILVVKSILVFIHPYESMKMTDILVILISPVKFFQLASLSFFCNQIASLFYIPILGVLGMVVAFYIKHKEYKKLGLYITAILVVFFFVAAVLSPIPYESIMMFYYEGMFLVWVSIVLVPFFVEMPCFKWRKGLKAATVMALILVYLINIIAGVLPNEQNNNQWLLSHVRATSPQPGIVVETEDAYARNYNDIIFYIPQKSLLLAALENPETYAIHYVTNDTTNYGTPDEPLFVIRNQYWHGDDFSIEDSASWYFPFNPYTHLTRYNLEPWVKLDTADTYTLVAQPAGR